MEESPERQRTRPGRNRPASALPADTARRGSPPPGRGSPAVIGLDVGTSAVKALLADADGPVRSVRRGYALDVGPGGRVELDAEDVWRAARSAIRALAAVAVARRLTVVAVCCGGSGDEAVWVDDDGRPVAPVPMALDTRAAADGATLVDVVGERRFIETTGLPPSGAYPLPRLLWLRRTAPAVADRVARLLAWPEFLALRLGLEPVAEPTLAARSGAFDVATGTWAPDLLRGAAIDATFLPPLAPTGAVIGTLPEDVAASVGLPDHVRVVAGGFDQAMATRGAGITRPGVAHLGAGSWEALTALTASRPLELVPRGSSLGPAIAAPGVRSVMTSSPGSAVLSWIGAIGRLGGDDAVFPGAPGPRALEAARRAPDEPTGLLVLPDLPGSAGAIAGLRLDVDAGRLARGMLEGVAFRVADEVDGLRAAGVAIEELRVTGGGTTDTRWIQLRADVLGMPVVAVEPPDAGVAAAAALAWAAVVADRSVDDVLATLVRLAAPIAPRLDHHERYVELRQRRSALADVLAPGR